MKPVKKLEVNEGRTKHMSYQNLNHSHNVTVTNKLVENVSKFNYLGFTITKIKLGEE
jgi:hypothetical protein